MNPRLLRAQHGELGLAPYATRRRSRRGSKAPVSNLIRLDNRPINDDRQECRAFLVVRDEAPRLPYLLDYHRALGVTRFFFVDNVSDDETLSYLLEQPDCHIYKAPESYASANYGVTWINQLIALHGINHWCLNIDADECLVYPDCETISLPRFCEYLDKTNADGLFTIMLDMYSDKSIAETVYRPGTPFLDTCPFFDADYHFRRRVGRYPTHEFIGGPRLRCFYPEFLAAGVVAWSLPKLLRSVRSKIGVHSETWGVVPPMLIKMPLIRGGAGHWISSHKTTPLRLADVTGVLLHFKFFSDFHSKVEIAIAERQHYDASSEYARYEAALRQDPGLSFYYDGSTRYQGSQDLVSRGFINTSTKYQKFAQIAHI